MSLVLDGTNGLSDIDGSAATPAIRGTDANTGIFFPAADTIAFAEGGTESMRIDSSGNLGIGTSSPATKLQVNSSTTTASNNVAWDTTGSTLNLAFTGTSATDAGSSISFNDQGTTGLAAIKGAREATSGNGYLSFLTRNGSGGQYATERARIDSSGNLLVGTTSVAGSGLSLGTPNSSGCFSYFSGSGGGYHWRFGAVSTGAVGSISTSGSTTTFSTSSDYRLKNTIAPMTGALAKVAALKPCTYKWNVDGSDGEGFIAHELAEVVPQCVTGEKDAVDADGNPIYQGIDTSFLVATLTAAIQEQQALIASQSAIILAQQTALTALTARVEALEGTQP